MMSHGMMISLISPLHLGSALSFSLFDLAVRTKLPASWVELPIHYSLTIIIKRSKQKKKKQKLITSLNSREWERDSLLVTTRQLTSRYWALVSIHRTISTLFSSVWCSCVPSFLHLLCKKYNCVSSWATLTCFLYYNSSCFHLHSDYSLHFSYSNTID